MMMVCHKEVEWGCEGLKLDTEIVRGRPTEVLGDWESEGTDSLRMGTKWLTGISLFCWHPKDSSFKSTQKFIEIFYLIPPNYFLLIGFVEKHSNI